MSETKCPPPTHAPAPTGAPAPPDTKCARPGRGETFAKGDADLTPSPEPQPVGKGPWKWEPLDWVSGKKDGAASDDGAKGSAIQTSGEQQLVAKPEPAESKADTKNLKVGFDIDRAIDDVATELESASMAAGRARELLEALVLLDGAQARADQAYRAAGKAYTDSKKLGLLDVIGFVIDIAGGIKAVVSGLRQGLAATRKTKLLNRAKAHVAGNIDFLVGAKGAAVAGAEMHAADSVDALSSDPAGNLVSRLHDTQAPMRATAKAMQTHSVAGDAAAMRTAFRKVQTSSDYALSLFAEDERVRTDARFAKMEAMIDAIESTSDDIADDCAACKRCIARGWPARRRGWKQAPTHARCSSACAKTTRSASARGSRWSIASSSTYAASAWCRTATPSRPATRS